AKKIPIVDADCLQSLVVLAPWLVVVEPGATEGGHQSIEIVRVFEVDVLLDALQATRSRRFHRGSSPPDISTCAGTSGWGLGRFVHLEDGEPWRSQGSSAGAAARAHAASSRSTWNRPGAPVSTEVADPITGRSSGEPRCRRTGSRSGFPLRS